MDKLKEIKTVNTIALFLLILFMISKIKWFLFVAVVFVFIGIAVDKAASFIAVYWMKFASFIGGINSKIILSVFYFFFMTPFVLICRIFNKDMIKKFRNNTRKSYFDEINETYSKENFEKTW